MEVVCHHMGTPRHNITAQNEKTIHARRLTHASDSGGGAFLAVAVAFPAGGSASTILYLQELSILFELRCGV